MTIDPCPKIRKWKTGGRTKRLKEVIIKTGYYSLHYERAAVRWIGSNRAEIVRMIYPAVRDQNWGTLEPTIVAEDVVQDHTGFRVSARAEYRQGSIHYQAVYVITGQGKRLTFSMLGEATSTFQSCRVGLCVLHPVKECSGKECMVTHPDRTTETLVFPERISPSQPMVNISEMTWRPTQEILAKLIFQGDTFEMEDQRNWADASYKTYSRPLELPFPYEVSKGETMQQEIVLELEGDRLIALPGEDQAVFRMDRSKTFKLPEIGVCNTSRTESLTDAEASLLKELPFKHLRVELRLFEKGWTSDFARIADEATRMELPLFLVLFLDKDWDREWPGFKKVVSESPVRVSHVLVVDRNHLPDDLVFKAVHAELKALFPDAGIGTGVNAYFAEINRHRPESELSDFISFSACPQVHAFDNSTMLENLEAQKYVVDSARAYFPSRQIFVSPITLKQRFNVVATSATKSAEEGTLPPPVDTRQNSVFAAQWMLGSIKVLAQSGADLGSYFETVGWCGFIQGEYPPPLPGKFTANAGDIFPLFTLFKHFAGFKKIVFSESDMPLKVDGLVLQNQEEIVALLANFTDELQKVRMEGMDEFDDVENLFEDRETFLDQELFMPGNSLIVLRKKP